MTYVFNIIQFWFFLFPTNAVIETIESNHYGYLKLELLNDRFTSTVTHWNTEENQTLDSIIIRGFEKNVTKVFVNQKEFPFKLEDNVSRVKIITEIQEFVAYHYISLLQVLEIEKLKNPLSENIVVSWK